MKSLNKILIKIAIVLIIGILLVIGVLCLIGFTIGGKIGLLHIILFLVLSILLGGFSARFIFSDTKNKNKVPYEALIAISLVFFVLFYNGYGALNSLSADSKYTEYQSSVIEVLTPEKSFHDEIIFKDLNGNEQMIKKYYLFGIFVEEYEKGDLITVEEKTGGFGYQIYKIIN